jgi:hypothetical protein
MKRKQKFVRHIYPLHAEIGVSLKDNNTEQLTALMVFHAIASLWPHPRMLMVNFCVQKTRGAGQGTTETIRTTMHLNLS